jgi:hypothetical protein
MPVVASVAARIAARSLTAQFADGNDRASAVVTVKVSGVAKDRAKRTKRTTP